MTYIRIEQKNEIEQDIVIDFAVHYNLLCRSIIPNFTGLVTQLFFGLLILFYTASL